MDDRDPAWPARRSRLARLRVVLLPGLLVLSLVLVAVIAGILLADRVQHDDDGAAAPQAAQVDGARIAGGGPAAAAVATAREAAVTYYSLDARRLDAGVARMKKIATDGFQRRYAGKVADLARQVRVGGVVLVARVPRDGLATEYLSTTSAMVLVVLDVTTRSSSTPAATRESAVRVTLQRQGGRWLVADLGQLG